MKQYAIVKDQISGEPFGIVIRDGFLDTCYGLSAKGEAWAESYNELETKTLQDELPYGVEVGDFRGMSHNEEIIIADMIDGNRDVSLPNRESMVYAGSQKTGAHSKLLDVSGAPLSFFENEDFQDAVEFKVRAFINESARSSVMAKVRVERLGVETKGMRFKSRHTDEYLNLDMSNIANGSGLLRRAVKEVFEAKAEARYDHSGYSLSPFEPEVKALGPKLGGGLRSAPRGMSFVDITGRVDGDSDGIVFEGVPGMERPIIPRFMVPKNMARRVSALVDGDSMEIEKQRRAGNANAAIDEGRLQELLGDQANLVRRIDGGAIQSRRADRRQREMTPIDGRGRNAGRVNPDDYDLTPIDGRGRGDRTPEQQQALDNIGSLMREAGGVRSQRDFGSRFGTESLRPRPKGRPWSQEEIDKLIGGSKPQERPRLAQPSEPLTERQQDEMKRLTEKLLNSDGSIKSVAQRRAEYEKFKQDYWKRRREQEAADPLRAYDDYTYPDFDEYDKRYYKDPLRKLRKLQAQDRRSRGEEPEPKRTRSREDQQIDRLIDQILSEPERQPYRGPRRSLSDNLFEGLRSGRAERPRSEYDDVRLPNNLLPQPNDVIADLTSDEKQEIQDMVDGVLRRISEVSRDRELNGRESDNAKRGLSAFSSAAGDAYRGERPMVVSDDILNDASRSLERYIEGNPEQLDMDAQDLLGVIGQISDSHSRDAVYRSPGLDEGGMRSQRDYVDMDLTMDEVAQLKETVDDLREAIYAANDGEANDLFDAFSEALEDAALGVDVVRLDRGNAEKIREMLDNVLGDEVDAGNPDPELSDVLDVVSRALDAPEGTFVSPALEDAGTRLSLRSQRLSRGDGQVRRDSRGNIIPEDPDRMNRLAESRDTRLRELGFDDDQIAQLTQGLRNRRALDDMSSDEVSTALTETNQRVTELREELGLDSFWDVNLNARPEQWRDYIRNKYDGDFDEGMALADEYRRQRALQRDLLGRKSKFYREQQETVRRQRRSEYVRGLAERGGFDPDEAELVLDEVLDQINEFEGQFPGEIIEDANNYTPARRRTGWGARINNEEESVVGRITEGPLKGATYEYFREETWSESTWNDPSESLGGHHSLYVETPSGLVYEFEGDIEDELGLESIHRPKGLRSSRATGKDLWTLVDGIDRNASGYADIDDRLMANIMEAAQVLNGNGHAGSAGKLANDLKASIRQLDVEGELLGINDSDRASLSNMLQDAIDELIDRRRTRFSGLRAKRKGNQKKPPQSSAAPKPNTEQRARPGVPKFTDTSNEHTVETVGFGPNGSRALKPPKVIHPDDRKLFKILKANGFAFDDPGGKGGKIIVPDRLFQWTKTQPADVIATWPGPIGGRFEAPPGAGIAFRTTHFTNKKSFSRAVRQWINEIFGPTAMDDLERNAKNGGIGKVGNVPSAEEVRRMVVAGTPGGMRSARAATPRRSPDRGITRADRRAAQMDVTGTSGLGGGMRSRRRRGIAGQTKMSDTDGKAWESLSDTQRGIVEQAARKREGALFWDITRRAPLDGARQNMMDDGLWRSDMSQDEMKDIPPPGDLLPIMQAELDRALRDGEINTAAHTSAQQQLDDLKTLAQMRSDKDYSLLEHLHGASKKRIIGDSRKEDNTIPTPARLGLDSESSFYSSAAGTGAKAQTDAVAERAAKRKGKRRVPLSDRILRPDPDRQQRRAARRARRRTGQNAGGYRTEESRISRTERARRRAAQLARRARARLRGGNNERNLMNAVDKHDESKPVRVIDGKVQLSDKAVEAIGSIKRIIDGDDTLKVDVKNGRGEEGNISQSPTMAAIWQAQGYNGLPQVVTASELEDLADLGHRIIVRGHGGRDSKNAEDWLFDPLRFLPGQGASAAGLGEYWSDGATGAGWFSWLGDPGQKNSTVAVLPKNAKLIMQSDARKEGDRLDAIGRALTLAETNFPGGFDKSPLDDVAAAMKTEFDKLDDEVKQGLAGQMIGQLIARAEAGDKGAIGALESMRAIAKQYGDNRANLLAALAGYDAVQVSPTDGRILIMSRPAVIAADQAIDGQDARPWIQKANEMARASR